MKKTHSLHRLVIAGDLGAVRELLARDTSEIEAFDHTGRTPLMYAVRNTDCGVEIVRELLARGASPTARSEQLLDLHRSVVGLALAGGDPEKVALLLHAGVDIRFGVRNPEQMEEPFWEGMIRAGVSAYEATQWFGGSPSARGAPVWCAQRFGQSMTLLPDGPIVQIGGEHEDHYDPDFCIYNDVFVHETDGTIRIFGYPESLFPPTHFHTATLVAPYLYVIGSLGYLGRRRVGETPVFRLDARDFRIECVVTRGAGPGWIYGHRADLLAPDSIRVSGGTVVTRVGEQEKHADNDSVFLLDTRVGVWSRSL